MGETPDIGWTFEPTVVVGVLLLALAYLACVGPLRRRFAESAPVSLGRQITFLAGVVLIALAQLSPLHALSDYLSSVHMIQHLVLTMAMPPLLLLGIPPWLLRPVLRWPGALRVGRVLTRAPVAFVLFNAVFWIWHWPGLYDLAVENEGIHVVEHLAFMVAGVILWWPICGPLAELPRLSPPLQMLYIFLNSVVGGVLGALIAFQSSPIYTSYADVPRVWGLSLMDDQRIGGLIMWVGGATVDLLVIVAIFLVWALREEPESYGTEELRRGGENSADRRD